MTLRDIQQLAPRAAVVWAESPWAVVEGDQHSLPAQRESGSPSLPDVLDPIIASAENRRHVLGAFS